MIGIGPKRLDGGPLTIGWPVLPFLKRPLKVMLPLRTYKKGLLPLAPFLKPRDPSGTLKGTLLFIIFGTSSTKGISITPLKKKGPKFPLGQYI